MQKPSRPTGVTLLAVLSILAGIVFLIGGAGAITVGLVIGTYAPSQISSSLATAGYPGLSSLGAGTIATILTVIGAVLLIVGILYLAVGAGFLGGKRWAWTLGIIGYIIGIVLNIVQIAFGAYTNVLGLVIGIIIVYYLTRPHVKAFFGKGGAMPASPMPQPSSV